MSSPFRKKKDTKDTIIFIQLSLTSYLQFFSTLIFPFMNAFLQKLYAPGGLKTQFKNHSANLKN